MNQRRELIRRTIMERTQDSISMSFVSTTVDELDPCFMYIQILKEILSTFEFEQDHIKTFLVRCRETFSNNEIETNYSLHTALWWYTSSNSICSTVNRALRMMDVSLMICLGFFIRDLLKNIDEIYSNNIDEWQRFLLIRIRHVFYSK